ncbi:class I SAM-dependent DNA methyltransferase [Saccharomonospora saliphila]|uniref:class I SAM-dependent DNA methyltransferase n=1 Tax=Saccharomonospora saliphila TaxID=369829 RepID=UPI00048AC5D7|nr:class I SAM-dependent methyltransferase [Saccharomonospora saliphila]
MENGTSSPATDGRAARTAVPVRLPEQSEAIDQDAEYCSVLLEGRWQTVRFHDYDRIFSVPGLYETLFHDLLDCRSPDVVGALLTEELRRDGVAASALRVLDLGAGNGLVAQRLRTVGAGHVVGVDILAEARQAALRDRAEVYDDYHVLDMTGLSDSEVELLRGYRFNALACVAALGYGDIPVRAFATAFNFVSDGGWVAFTIKDRFLSETDESGFARLVRRCEERGLLRVRASRRYRHRLDVRGEPLHYVAVVGIKQADIGADLLD